MVGILIVGTVILGVALGVALVASLIITLLKGDDKEKKALFTTSAYVSFYLHVVSFIALVALVVFTMQFTNALFAKYVSPDMGYYVSERVEVTEENRKDFEGYNPNAHYEDSGYLTMEKNGKVYYYDNSQINEDFILYGLTILIMSVIYGIHRLYSGKYESLFKRVLSQFYDLAGLFLFGVTSIVMIPMSISTIVKYYVSDTMGYSSAMFGESIAVLVVVFPLWMFFLNKVIKTREKKS